MNEQTIGRYQILERVGRGGMGVLYRGTDPVLDREVAIKVMSGEFSEDDQEARGRFFREARAAARLQHRNIVTVFEFAEQDGVPYIVMEFLHGRSLSTRMAMDPPLALDQTLDIMSQLCTGLQFAHENGVVHRDVKPANVWLLADGGVKLLDFGIAKLAATTFTRRGDVLGSACYMAPEQVSGKPVDGRADIFSAGVVLYELLAHRKPFDAESPTAALMKIIQEDPDPIEQIVPRLPATLIDALNRALKKNPDERYQTAADFGADVRLVRMALQSSLDTLVSADLNIGDTLRMSGTLTRVVVPGTATTAARTPGEPAPPSPPPRPVLPVRPILVGVAAVVLAIAAWLFFVRPHPAPEPTKQAEAPPAAPAQPPVAASQPPAVPAMAGATHAAPLHVTSEPAGAAIAVDGRATGMVTPADLQIDTSARQLRLTKDGFKPTQVRLSSRTFSEGAVSVTLQAAEAGGTVKVTLTGSYPFEVYESGRQLSAAGTAHELDVASSHVIRLRAESYLLDYPVKVAGGADRTMEIRAPELGRVTIRGMETCRVFLGSFDLGYPPINGQAVAAGTYSVQLKCPDGQVLHSPSITVIAGQSVMVKVP